MKKTTRMPTRVCIFSKLGVSLCLGQLLSLCLCATAVTSGILGKRGIFIPTAQSFLNYVLLCLVYTTLLACRREGHLIEVLRQRWWKYALLALVDVEANYLIVKAYHYTTVTSVQLLDCLTIPTVLILSWVFLRVRYKLSHFAGVGIALIGVGLLVLADFLVAKDTSQGVNKLLGDFLCLLAAVLYGLSNVGQEYVVKSFNRVEFLGMIGLFGSFFNGIQFALLERNEVASLDFTQYQNVLCLLGFALALFTLYSLMPVALEKTSATLVNLNLLSADFYALLVGLFVFQYKFHWLYFISFVLILLGLLVYSIKPTPTMEQEEHAAVSERSSLTDMEQTPLNPTSLTSSDLEQTPVNPSILPSQDPKHPTAAITSHDLEQTPMNPTTVKLYDLETPMNSTTLTSSDVKQNTTALTSSDHEQTPANPTTLTSIDPKKTILSPSIPTTPEPDQTALNPATNTSPETDQPLLKPMTLYPKPCITPLDPVNPTSRNLPAAAILLCEQEETRSLQETPAVGQEGESSVSLGGSHVQGGECPLDEEGHRSDHPSIGPRHKQAYQQGHSEGSGNMNKDSNMASLSADCERDGHLQTVLQVEQETHEEQLTLLNIEKPNS